MDWITFSLGVLALLYGISTLWFRKYRPDLFSKLGPMQERYGGRTGIAVHFISYTLIPMGVGINLIVKGWRGQSLFF